MLSKRFYGAAMMAAMAAVPALAACSSDNPLCCTEFKVGATNTADIGGGAESQVAAQAVADIGGIASAAIDDLTTACRGIAQDLDADKAQQDAAEANSDKGKKMQAWCALAVSTIGSVKASASVTIQLTVQPPVCEASISAKADCQAKCSGSAKCDVKANPPTCTGGKLTVSCSGSCSAEANASVSCTGSCSGECQGGCTVQGGIQCAGKCEGTCEGSGGAGTSGTDAQGNCQGTCKGTCRATPPGVMCTGSCSGSCKGTCKAEAGAKVQCDGKCDGDFEPLKCEGGKLEGGCKVEAKCDANCDASVSAKAECKPPQIALTITGGAQASVVAKLQATLEANLPIIFGLKAKLEGVVQATGSFSGNISAVADIKAACIPVMIAAAGTAIDQVTISAKATADVTGSVQ